MYLLRRAGQAASSQQSHQSEEMIAVQVRDEDARDVAELERRVLELMLRAFAAIKQPHFGALRQAQRHAGNIARLGRDARTRA